MLGGKQMMISNTSGQRWVPAPVVPKIFSSTFSGVWLYPDEDIEWTYLGDEVIGYTIRTNKDAWVKATVDRYAQPLGLCEECNRRNEEKKTTSSSL